MCDFFMSALHCNSNVDISHELINTRVVVAVMSMIFKARPNMKQMKQIYEVLADGLCAENSCFPFREPSVHFLISYINPVENILINSIRNNII